MKSRKLSLIAMLVAVSSMLVANIAVAGGYRLYTTINDSRTQVRDGNNETGIYGSTNDCAYNWLTTKGTRGEARIGYGWTRVTLRINSSTFFGSRTNPDSCWRKWAYNNTLVHTGIITDGTRILLLERSEIKTNAANLKTYKTQLHRSTEIGSPLRTQTNHIATTKSGIRFEVKTVAEFRY